ncbi:MAG: ATP-binding cassette domain-containing protein [Actinobacteria bacterium]|nr:ATP-binding cassette domain-containing protein [Actinomycetota bacterium]
MGCGSKDALSLADITKTFRYRGEWYPTVADTSLSARDGEVVSLVGPSGCGKSTLLNMIAGLVVPDTGHIACGGDVVRGPNTRVGYLTQDDALLPWRTVRSNVALPLEIRGLPRSERRARAMDILGQVGLGGFERHYPAQLSGGMRKRVSLARTLVSDVRTLLLDEPFGALDAQTRVLSQRLLTSLVERMQLTVVLVTHDLDEAITLSDRVVVLSRRPARILDVVSIPLARPRDVTEKSSEHMHLYRQIWTTLAEQLEVKQESERDLGPAARSEGE